MSLIESISIVVFWISAGAIFYVYIGYPALVFVLSRIFRRQANQAKFEPSVSVIITAYNEERDIAKKIENTLGIDYPKEKLEIIVASDCSTDGTDEIVQGYAGQNVRLIRQDRRLGKTSAQNMAVREATGDIILFSDATTMYETDVLKQMLPNFADDSVGCVAGSLIYRDPSDSNVGSGARSYWNYESSLRQWESEACSLIGASGCLYAVRRSAYVPMYPEACSDFLIATVVYRQGLRTVFEPTAICVEETNRDSRKEFQMRVRVIAQTFTDLWRNRDMLNPFKAGFFAIELFSHKLLRYALPLFFLGTFASSGILASSSSIFLALFIFELLFAIAAGLGAVLDRNRVKAGALSLPFYFFLANGASIVGLYKFLKGERYAHWEPIRSNS